MKFFVRGRKANITFGQFTECNIEGLGGCLVHCSAGSTRKQLRSWLKYYIKKEEIRQKERNFYAQKYTEKMFSSAK